jgi:ankyrin repeat protein
LTGIQDDVGKLLRRQHDQEHETILEWLTPIDYASQQSDIINRRQEGTGLWLLTSEEFQKWVNQGKETLFCPGIPGAGKTMLSSIVVDHLSAKFENNASVGIAYIYCNYQSQQEQKPANLLSSLLKQLAQEQPAMPTDVKNLYKRHKNDGTQPSFEEIVRVLHSTIRLYSRVFIIIDALDEYHASNNNGLNRLLSGVFGLQDQVQLSLFATSRFVAEITSQFDGCILKEIRAQDDDVLLYVDGRIHELLRSQISKHPQIQDTVRRDIMKAVDGMYVVLLLAYSFSQINVNIRFLLARLHMDSLKSQPTLGHIKRALQNLPQGMGGLNETYKQAIERIEGQEEGYRQLAKQVLAWVTHAKRTLSTTEVQHALAVNVGKAELDKDFIPEVEILGSICAGLVTIDKKRDVIQLVHYTTQEYFERTSLFPNAETDITATCVTYLSFNTFATGICPTKEQLKLYRLYDYAARNWGHHARAASAVDQLVVDFLESEAKISSSVQAMMASRSYSTTIYSRSRPRKISGVHVAAYFGLREALIALLKNGQGLDPEDGDSRTPLWKAAENGHEAVVKLLVEKGAKLNFKDMVGLTPLWAAAENGHEAIVKLLVEKGAEFDFTDTYDGQTPLWMAAKNGHEAVVKLLVENGAKLNFKDKYNDQTPLWIAAAKGHEAVVKLLVEKGAEVDFKDKHHGQMSRLMTKVMRNRVGYGQTPLWVAAKNGHEAVVKLLVEKGAELDFKDKRHGQTPLQVAAKNGHEAIVKLLVEKGAKKS